MNEQDRIQDLNTDVDHLMREGAPIGAAKPEDAPLLVIAQALVKADLSEEAGNRPRTGANRTKVTRFSQENTVPLWRTS
ncbi:MAG: hypothetical protein JXB07_11795 [Anaerolineae bacterium]|nr:hypothetical protein [Anaerolineae bacterium]